MTPPFAFGKTITLTRQTVDTFGKRTAGASITVAGCVVYGTPDVETVGGQDTIVDTGTVLAPAGTVVYSTDRVTIDGDTFEVSSDPINWQNPQTGDAPGVQFTIRRVAG